MELKKAVFLLSVLLFYIDSYLVYSLWFRGKHTVYMKIFLAMGFTYSFWGLFNGVNYLLSEELYHQLYLFVMVAVCIAPPLMLFYMLHFTGSKYARSRILMLTCTILTALDVIMLLTNPLHHEFISGYDGIYPLTGRWFIVHAFIAYVPLFAAIIILFRYIIRNVKKTPSLAIVGLSVLLPLTLNILYTFGIMNLGFDITPFAFLVMFTTFTVHSIRLGLFDNRNSAVESLFISLSDSFLIIDNSGHVTDANPSFRKSFPMLEIEPEKTAFDDIVCYFDSITIEQNPVGVYQLLRSYGEEIHDAEVTLLIGGDTRYYVLSKDIVRERAQYAGFILSLIEVTNNRRTNQMIMEINEKNETLLELKNIAESASKSKSDFLARTSHEIRTPMNAIMGMSELILREELPHNVYENALAIRNASTNLLSIINDILDFSKIESGMLEITESNYMFPSLINDVISVIRMRLIEKPVQFAVCIDNKIPLSLCGDEIRVRQIFFNLLSNAVKYTEKGSVSLSVSGELNDGIVILEITVSDTGIGIKPEDFDKLFGDFSRLDPTKNKSVEGTGLGLAITRNLCHAMGGDISFHSDYGTGSEFVVTLPQSYDTYLPCAVVKNPNEKSVLIYETREAYRDSIVCTLSMLGIRCENAENISMIFKRIPEYPYLFISSFMYESIKPALAKLNSSPHLVLIADVNESTALTDAELLSMPAHAISIANILNGVHEEPGRVTATGVSFTAPDARILIVDDISANLKVAEGLMAPYKMQIDLSASGNDAVRMIQENTYDLVFMDHMMPEMDGIEATAIIRALEGTHYHSLPIIALTANAVSGIREMFVQNGMNDFLAKPIEMTKLNSILEKWIPKAKHRKVDVLLSGDVCVPSESADFVNAVRKIKWLSSDKASAALGDYSVYEKVFRLSVRLLPENIEKLESFINTDLSRYAVEVHGIKGVLNGIGAYSLGDEALELENLSKANDANSCEIRHPSFIADVKAFLEAAAPLLGNNENEKSQSGFSRFADTIPEIEEALHSYDGLLALELLSQSAKYSYGQVADSILSNLVKAFEQFDYDKAADYLHELKTYAKDVTNGAY